MLAYKRIYRTRFFLFIIALMFLVISGCRNNSTLPGDEFLLRTGDSVITVNDYRKALEIAKTAYSHGVLQKPEVMKKIQLRLFSQLAEEMIVIKVAAEKNIVVTEEELGAEIDAVKKEYPDDVFDEMLLDNAITYELWKTMLQRRLLIEKVLGQELDSTINITPEALEEYYKKNSHILEPGFTEDPDEHYSRLVKKIRLEKRQEKYQHWIEKKKKEYSIEVNEKIWEKITGQ